VRSRWLERAPLLAAAAALLAIAWPMLHGRFYLINDLGGQNLPYAHFYYQCLHHGDNFLWCPTSYNGYYLHGEGQVGMLHPLHLLLYRLLPFTLAFNFFCLLPYPLLLFGWYRLLGRYLDSREARGFGALAMMLPSFFLLHLIHTNMITVLAHLPWLLWCVDLLLREPDPRRRRRAGFGLVLLTGSQLLLGHPQAVWMSCLAEGAYALLVVGASPAGTRPWRQLIALGLWKALGLATGAVQLLPTLAMLADSKRHVVDEAFRLSGSLHPANLLQLWAPYLFKHRVVTGAYPSLPHEFGLYSGMGIAVLAVWGALRYRRLRYPRGLLPAILLAGFAGLWLMLGAYGGLYTGLSLLPPFSLTRVPARFMVFFQLAVGLLAACGVVDLASRRGRAGAALPRVFWWTLAVPVLSLLTPLLLTRWPAWPLAALPLRLVGPLLAISAWGLVYLAARGHRLALALLALHIACDMTGYGMTFYYRAPVATLAEFRDSLARSAPPIPGRIRSAYAPFQLLGLPLTEGCAALEPRRHQPPASYNAASLVGTHWVGQTPLDRLPAPGSTWFPVPDPMPRARLVTQTQLVPRDSDMSTLISTLDIAHTALVYLPLALPPSAPGSANCTVDRPGYIDVTTSAPAAQLLVLTESYHPGWRLSIDGAPAASVCVYGNQLGCVVPGGTHAVRFRFAPADLRHGAIVSAAALLLACLWRLWPTPRAEP